MEEGSELDRIFKGGNTPDYDLISKQLKLDDVMTHVVGDSTPGIPFMRLGQKNKDVLEYASGDVKRAVVSSFLHAIVAGESVFSQTPEELVKGGIRDPVRLFIKNEPHSAKKVSEGKFRLISGVSLRDQIKERCLGAMQNNAEIENWSTCPSRPGIGLNDEGLLTMAEYFKNELKIGPVDETDVSGWDWSVQYWELRADAECRRRLMKAEKGTLVDFLLRVQALCVASSVLCLPGGEMISQEKRGIQLSGSYWTSSTNSRMRVLVSLVGREDAGVNVSPDGKIGISAMGDDSTERHFEGLKECLERYGHRVKFVKSNTELNGISFCSHAWMDSGLAAPETAIKTVFRYLSHPRLSPSYPEWFAQLGWTLRNHGDKERLLSVCRNRVDEIFQIPGIDLPQTIG